MPRYRVALLVGLLALGSALTQEKDADPPAPPAGTWKMMLPTTRAAAQPIWLLSFEKKGDGYEGKVLDTAREWPKAKIKDVTAAKGVLRFLLESPTLNLTCEVRLPDGKADLLRGLTTINKNPTPLEMERTAVASLDPVEGLREELAKKPLGMEATRIALTLLQRAKGDKVKPPEARAWAEKAVKSAELYGPAWHREVILMAAEILSDEKGFEAIGLQYARRAERMLDPKEPAAIQKRVFTVLASALEGAGKSDEAKETLAKLKKLDFRIKPKAFAGRKGKSDRAVLVELFTGSNDDRGVALDLTADALSKTYKPGEVILLSYHLNAGGSDPLAAMDSEARFNFYESVEQPPALLLDGKLSRLSGGSADESAERYDEAQAAINPLLEKEAEGKIALSAKRKGDKITIEANVSDLKRSGDDVRLRLALVEKEVEHKGKSGVTKHANVVRFMAGGDAGVVMKDKAVKHAVTVDLADVRKKQKEYWDKVEAKQPFAEKEKPYALKELRVVAFVQDDKNNEVLQAAVADVKAEE